MRSPSRRCLLPGCVEPSFARAGFGLLWMFAALSLCAGAARAQTSKSPDGDAKSAKLECVRSFERAQQERNLGHYLRARDQLLHCGEPRCGEIISAECSRLFALVEPAIPSVVFSARDATGSDKLDVSVSSEGRLLLARLDGKATPLDPGLRHFSFDSPGFASIERDVLIRAGDKYWAIDVTFETAPSPSLAGRERHQPGTVEAARTPIPTSSYVLGGAALVGGGTFVVLRILGSNGYDALARRCAPNCSEHDIDPVERKYVLSNVALGLGAAALTGAVTIYLLRGDDSTGRPSVSLDTSQGGLRATIGSHF
jgi:hypothetical protein